MVTLLGWEDPLGKETVTHSNIFDWEIPWTEEPGGLQSGVAELDTTEHTHAHVLLASEKLSFPK